MNTMKLLPLLLALSACTNTSSTPSVVGGCGVSDFGEDGPVGTGTLMGIPCSAATALLRVSGNDVVDVFDLNGDGFITKAEGVVIGTTVGARFIALINLAGERVPVAVGTDVEEP